MKEFKQDESNHVNTVAYRFKRYFIKNRVQLYELSEILLFERIEINGVEKGKLIITSIP